MSAALGALASRRRVLQPDAPSYSTRQAGAWRYRDVSCESLCCGYLG